MEVEEPKPTHGYGKPPWVFKGRALYQLHLVKAETARAFIPKEFRIVEAFGHTLGGFFLASYDDSPVGTFDELVVIAGIVWNPPTSCAWAARVLVNSEDACIHGRKDVGLPSQVARFTKRITAIPKTPGSKVKGFLDKFGGVGSENCMDIQVTEVEDSAATDICNICLTSAAVPELDSRGWMGPITKMFLPSFSGRTEYNPHLLKYSCQIECRVKAVKPAKVSRASQTESSCESQRLDSTTKVNESKRNLSISVMLSKPILALEFSSLIMKVEAPTLISQCSENPIESC